jgi:hypothetical protein
MRGLLGSVAIVLVTVAGCATPRSAVERGVALYHQGRWAAAAAAFEEAIAASPGDPDLYRDGSDGSTRSLRLTYGAPEAP